MCVAVLCLKGEELKRHYFDSFARVNNDGYGFAYVRGKTLTGFRTMNLNEFYSRYKEAFLSHGKDSPFILHFRLGTQGTKDVTNCHPFFPNTNIAFIHNGCLPFHKTDEKDTRSDTHIFSDDHLANLPAEDIMHNPTTKALLEDMIGKHNKIIFLDSHKDYLILNEDCGHWLDKKIWFSNTSYMSSGFNQHSGYERSHKHNRDNCCLCNNEFRRNWLYTFIDDFYREAYVCKNCMKKHKITTLSEFFDMLRTHSNTKIGEGDL